MMLRMQSRMINSLVVIFILDDEEGRDHVYYDDQLIMMVVILLRLKSILDIVHVYCKISVLLMQTQL